MSLSEPLDDPWADSGPGDRLPASRRRPDADRAAEGRRGRDDQHERGRESDTWDGGASFERVPPQDPEAEQSVLGGMLLSKDAIADVVEVLKGRDFYRPAHETVFQAILDLYAKGEPADPITVAAELTRRGEITRIGGAAYLHSLVQTVPTAANAEYYAEIVRERAVLRRLVEAGTRITQMGYAADGDVDEIVNSAQAEIYAVTEQRTSEDYLPLGDIMEGALDEIEAIGSRSGEMTGVPTGFTDFDSLTNGLHPGQMIVIAARPAMGKALALDTPLPTPTGWTTMGEVAEGDLLMGADGRPTRVVAATEVMEGRPCFEITFDDGTSVIADADHQWLTDTRASRRSAQEAAAGKVRAQRVFASVRTTKEIAETVRCAADDRRMNHSVRLGAPLDLPDRDLPVEPYTLGVWLGDADGDAAAHATGDPQLSRYRAMGLLGNRHIPGAYLRASLSQRRALLAGLLHSGGRVHRTGAVRFAAGHPALADGFRELVLSLGYRCGTRSERVRGRSGQPSTRYVVTFSTDDEVFRPGPGQQVHRARRRPVAPRLKQRFIRDVQEVSSVPVRCVQVDNPAHLYLATRSMVPTHNSTLALDFARSASIKNDLPSVIFSLEMGRNEIAMRLLSAEARVALHHMRSGTMTDDDWTRLARRMPEVTAAPLYIDDSPNLSMMEIRAKCRRLKQRHDLRLVVIDYLQLMQSGGSRRAESRQQEVSDMSRNLKLLAKELELPVIALSQLNRGPEQRTDKKPMVSDLRESGCMTADTALLRADTGAPVTFAELMANGHEGVLVWSLDEAGRLVRAPVTHVFSSGTKPVFRLRLASGRRVKATANHPFLTGGGWRPLGELAAGSVIAVPRRVPAPLVAGLDWPDSRIGELAEAVADDATGARAERVPDAVYAAGDREVAVFLRRLWECGAGADTAVGAGAAPDTPSFTTSSRELADAVAVLLSRFGIVSRIEELGAVARGGAAAGPEGRGPRCRVVVADAAGSRVFHQVIGAAGGAAPGRVLDDGAVPASEERNDVFWDRVVAIEPLGEQPVFDATVKGTHNFIADGILAHNSIEQDADMVILLHREDAYEKESPRAGEADLIVAKHRNGPTATITVAFQGHYSRFVDMAGT
ncbi:hypothetical protein GCM10018793_03700 [Streptomyces sulfonofaciens]|uniref:Replicative DNA helicase n=1 Tax=Streptomyces sulfonofaciens TaxID=68272 RepID=A0A919FPP2_9ACTN|nr:hypothetical protein GCM10018793_03700 [Streptomyces sulfonofaciens]